MTWLSRFVRYYVALLITLAGLSLVYVLGFDAYSYAVMASLLWCGLILGLALNYQPKEECRRCRSVRQALRIWLGRQGHDRCWYYPEIFAEIAGHVSLPLYHLNKRPKLPGDPLEFVGGCLRYAREEYTRAGGYNTQNKDWEQALARLWLEEQNKQQSKDCQGCRSGSALSQVG